MNETIYYLIFDCLVGKKEGRNYYLFREGEWFRDSGSIIMDHLNGYDPGEPAGSPYGMGNGSVMGDIDEISYERAMELTGGIS